MGCSAHATGTPSSFSSMSSATSPPLRRGVRSATSTLRSITAPLSHSALFSPSSALAGGDSRGVRGGCVGEREGACVQRLQPNQTDARADQDAAEVHVGEDRLTT
jgi:hypothetical protein